MKQFRIIINYKIQAESLDEAIKKLKSLKHKDIQRAYMSADEI